ncbi:hypothetical protein [Salipiger marinus]|uniref:hypothetical protein n=1 Tax=Salipiger marinus TaxID=555512 RepID=UPI0010421BAD|nr:hypothetical protein [Salipiger marinus]
MRKKDGTHIAAFTVLIVTSIWMWWSGSLWFLFETRTSIETSCSSTGDNCLKIIYKRDTGIDYTTRIFVAWDQDLKKFGSLPDSYLAFDPETSVHLTWLSQNSVRIEYEGGGYKLFGSMPQEVFFEFKRAG